jgi:hypothetical protein
LHVLALADALRVRAVDVATESLIIEIASTEDKIDGLVETSPIWRAGDGSQWERGNAERCKDDSVVNPTPIAWVRPPTKTFRLVYSRNQS